MSRALFFGILGLTTALVSPVLAADSVALRINNHQDRVRVVLAWPEGTAPSYKIAPIDDRTLEVRFATAGELSAFQPDAGIPEIADIREVSPPGQPLRVWISLAAPLAEKDLQVGSRIIVDVSQSPALRDKVKRAQAAAKEDAAAIAKVEPAAAGTPQSKEVAGTPQSKEVAGTSQDKETAPAPQEKAGTPPREEELIPAPKNEEKNSLSEPQKEEASPAPARAVEPPVAKAKAPTFKVDPANPPLVSISTTESFGLAAFVDRGRLWIVVDQKDFLVTPKVIGKGAESFKPFDRLDLPGATAFVTSLPEGVGEMRVEGGDLYWRLVMAPPPDPTKAPKPLSPEREEEGGKSTLLWPFEGATSKINIKDPLTGETYHVVTVQKSGEMTGPARRFTEFVKPLTLAGFAARAIVDDLEVKPGKHGVSVGRASGLSVTSALTAQSYTPGELEAPPSAQESEQNATQIKPEEGPSGALEGPVPAKGTAAQLFRMDRWGMGGLPALLENERALLGDLAEKKTEDRVGGIMNLGRMFLASGRGAEALGYLRLAADLRPELAETPEYIGLRGAAYTLNGQFDLAYSDLRDPALDVYPDIAPWRGYVLSQLEDWKQASEKMGRDLSWIRQYPPSVAQPMLLTLAETELRAGDRKRAEAILAGLAGKSAPDGKHTLEMSASLAAAVQAGQKYLMAESARQAGNKTKARELWQELTKSPDDLYRAKARLALTVLDSEDGKIKPEEAIDQLEALRYAWRGDELEASVNARLGELYLQRKEYIKGFNVLKDASTLSPETEMGRRITAVMTGAFHDLYLGKDFSKVDPLQAIAVYERFPELSPPGEEGDRVVDRLVDRLVDVDLLDRAAATLKGQVEHRLQGDRAVEAALRLAAIELKGRKPDSALSALNEANERLAGVTTPEKALRYRRNIQILKARALFLKGQADQALASLSALPEGEDILRQKADIAWQTGRWSDAALALEKLLSLTPLPADKPLTDAQAELIRNLAVATNLSGDRGRLVQLRAAWQARMNATKMGEEFEIVTRERQMPTLADRDTLTRLVSEVDLFGAFLDSYRTSAAEEKPAEATPAPAAGAPAAEAAPEKSTKESPAPAQAESAAPAAADAKKAP